MNHSTHDGDHDVREWLREATADALTSGFDADRTIRRARVRRRNRFAAGATSGVAGLAVVALLTVPALHGRETVTAAASAYPSATVSASRPPAAQVTTCVITDLPMPDGLGARGVTHPSQAFVTAMDPTGAYVVANAFDSHYYAAAVILWHNRVATVLPTHGLGGVVASTMAVNAHGVVAGTGEAPGAVGFAWVYRDGVVTRLSDVPGYSRLVQVYGVDDSGDVLGTALSVAGDHSIVIVWPAAAPEHPRIQSALTDRLGELVGAGYDGNGQLYAWSLTAKTPTVFTSDGRQHRLALPDGFTAGGVTGVHGSWAVGVVSRTWPMQRGRTLTPDPDHEPVPVRWNLGGGPAVIIDGSVMTTEETLEPAFVTTKTRSAVAGYTVLDGSFANRLFVLPTDGDVSTPVAVSDDASTIAGSVGPADSHDYGGNTRPVLWHC
jgi:hypothetical protein